MAMSYRIKKKTKTSKKPIKAKKTRKTKRKIGYRLIRLGIKLSIIAIPIALLFMFHYSKKVDKLISVKFDQERRWNVPSTIYTDAEYIYTGFDVKARHLIKKLDRLSYRHVKKVSLPGDYSIGKTNIAIYLHDFEYPSQDFKGFSVKLNLENDKVVSIIKVDDKSEIGLIRLEPEELAPIFDSAMEKRTLIQLNEVPEGLIASILLIEDERFFKHRGVDPRGIARAFVVNLKHGRVVQGGSTLTQQLVKNFFLYPRRSIWRKLNEMFIAWRIERAHTKSEILQAYLNEIYLGQRGTASINGVGEAAKYYFAKNVGQLTIAECAVIAGMIKAPNLYNAYKNPEKAIERRNIVLMKLYSAGLLSKDHYEESINEPIITPKLSIKNISAPYFVDYVKTELAENFPSEILQSEGLKIFTTLDMTDQIFAEKAVEDGLKSIESYYKKRLPKKDELQSCLLSISPTTGYVRAMVGGRDYSQSQFNRCYQAHRQTGSTFKPFVYLTALSSERSNVPYTPASLIEDTSFTIESGGEDWTPKNYDKEDHGMVTLRASLEHSYNIATAKIALETGLKNIIKTARDAGFQSHLSPVPSIALGAFEATPIELAYSYAVFANGGLKIKPIAVMQVVTAEGEVLERKRSRFVRKFDAKNAYITTNIMRGVLERGTAVAAKAYGYDGIAAGKTGTTSNYRDAWFVGFTPKSLALVWVGYDDNETTTLSGASGALPIWARYMAKVEPQNARTFISPTGTVTIEIDSKSGKLASNECPDNIIQETFIEGTEPEEECTKLDRLVTEPLSF